MRVAIILGIAVILGLAGCEGFRPAPPPPESGPSTDPCPTGQWHQTEGRQRLDVSGQPLELHLVSGGAELTLAADGTGTLAYATPAAWTGENAAHELAATFTGTATLTYTATGGTWTQVSDQSGIVTTLTMDGTADQPRPGTSGRGRTGTYRCTDRELSIATDTTSETYTRSA